jgi:hypothetical protein
VILIRRIDAVSDERDVDEVSRRVVAEDAEMLARLADGPDRASRPAVGDAREFARRFAERHRRLLDRLAEGDEAGPGS